MGQYYLLLMATSILGSLMKPRQILHREAHNYDIGSVKAYKKNDTIFILIAVTLYNCSVYAESCSLCTSANTGSSLNCYWCRTSSPSGTATCTDLSSCSSEGNIFLINSSTLCYSSPIVR